MPADNSNPDAVQPGAHAPVPCEYRIFPRRSRTTRAPARWCWRRNKHERDNPRQVTCPVLSTRGTAQGAASLIKGESYPQTWINYHEERRNPGDENRLVRRHQQLWQCFDGRVAATPA